MLKVLYLINHAGKAGTEKYIHTLMSVLHNNKIKAYFVYNEEGPLVEWVKELGIEPKRIAMKNPMDIWASKLLKNYCEENAIDIIHTQFLRENYIALMAKFVSKKFKVFYTNHFIMESNKKIRYTYKIYSQLQDQVIAVCNKGKEMMIENGFAPSKIDVIFNGVDVSYWGTPINSTLRSEFEIGEDEFVLLCCSRFAHDKGHQFLINSILKLKQITDKKIRLVLANDGPLLDKCKKLTSELGLQNEIVFTGYRKDVKNLIYGADLYINSSEHEALSFAIIEVLACGIPVIATDMAGNGDIINKQTNCGELVEYNNPTMLAQRIKNLIDNPSELAVYKQNAKKTAMERFSIEKMVEKTYNLYTLKTNP